MKPFSPNEMMILTMLAMRQSISIEQIIERLYRATPECDWPECPEANIRVFVCRLRKTLAPLGIEIRMLGWNPHHPGRYSIPLEQRKRARFIAENYWSILSGDVELEPVHVV